MSTLETDLVQPSTGTTLTLGASGDTISIPSGAIITNSGTANGFGGDNTPRFEATKTAAQNSYADSTWVKVTFNWETTDSDGAYASDKFTVPSGEGGTYYFYSTVSAGTYTGGGITYLMLSFYKNGSIHTVGGRGQFASLDSLANWAPVTISTMMTLSATDYVEVYVYSDTTDTNATAAADYCNFGGFKLL